MLAVQGLNFLLQLLQILTRDSTKGHEARARLPDCDELPEYGIEALVSTIDNQRDLIAAIRREVRWNKSLRHAARFKSRAHL